MANPRGPCHRQISVSCWKWYTDGETDLNNSPVGTWMRASATVRPAVAGVCSVPAGGTVSIEMRAQPGDRSCATEAIGGNHGQSPFSTHNNPKTDSEY